MHANSSNYFLLFQFLFVSNTSEVGFIIFLKHFLSMLLATVYQNQFNFSVLSFDNQTKANSLVKCSTYQFIYFR